jgi:hypothetical protein
MLRSTDSDSFGFLVGVTGSGKGMTEYQAKEKHKFDQAEELA